MHQGTNVLACRDNEFLAKQEWDKVNTYVLID